MSNWFRKTKIAQGKEGRYRVTAPIDIHIQPTGDPEADQNTAYTCLMDALGTSPNIESGFIYLSDVQLHSEVMKEEGIGF